MVNYFTLVLGEFEEIENKKSKEGSLKVTITSIATLKRIMVI